MKNAPPKHAEAKDQVYSGGNFLSHKTLITPLFSFSWFAHLAQLAIAVGGGCGIAHSSLVHSGVLSASLLDSQIWENSAVYFGLKYTY